MKPAECHEIIRLLLLTMNTIVLALLTLYALKPVVAASRGRHNVMAFREQSRFRSCCFVDIFCFTVCFHSGERNRHRVAAGERLDTMRHPAYKRLNTLTLEGTNSNFDTDVGHLSPVHLNEVDSTHGPHRHRHHHGERFRSKRSAGPLWNKLRFVQMRYPFKTIGFSIKFDLIKSSWSIVYIEGSQVIISIYYIFLILANSAVPEKMLLYAAFHLGLPCLPKYPFSGGLTNST